jgi:hypothetical protein
MRTLKVPCAICHKAPIIADKCVSRRTRLSGDFPIRPFLCTEDGVLSPYDRRFQQLCYDSGAVKPFGQIGDATSQPPVLGYDNFIAPRPRIRTGGEVRTQTHPSDERGRLGVVDLDHSLFSLLFQETPRSTSDSDIYGDAIDRTWMADRDPQSFARC